MTAGEKEEPTLAEAQVADAGAPQSPPVAEEAASVEMQPYQTGFWNGYPNYSCPHCQFSTLGGPGVIEDHIEQRHPGAWLAGITEVGGNS